MSEHIAGSETAAAAECTTMLICWLLYTHRAAVNKPEQKSDPPPPTADAENCSPAVGLDSIEPACGKQHTGLALKTRKTDMT